MKLRKPGDAVELRYRRDDHTIALHPVTVIEDSREHTVLALTPGTIVLQPEYHRAPEQGVNRAIAAIETWASGPPRLVASEWGATEVLQLFEPERWFAIYHMWNADTGAFLCWYVNYQIPFSRTRTGFATRDLALDLVVGPDLRYGLKDEHEFATWLLWQRSGVRRFGAGPTRSGCGGRSGSARPPRGARGCAGARRRSRH